MVQVSCYSCLVSDVRNIYFCQLRLMSVSVIVSADNQVQINVLYARIPINRIFCCSKINLCYAIGLYSNIGLGVVVCSILLLV